MATSGGGLDRRSFLTLVAGWGLAGSLFPGVLWAKIQSGPITKAELQAAEKLSGLSFTDAERDLMLADLEKTRTAYQKLREVRLDNADGLALRFDPILPGVKIAPEPKMRRQSRPPKVAAPNAVEELAFAPLGRLAALLRSRQVSSEKLTRMYLARIKKHDAKLNSVIHLCADRALGQARQADREIAAGRYRGPLHGIPWGVKDLLATKGVPTTWGAKPYRRQMLDTDATVVERLDKAGAVLLAKLSVGALAWGDVWFGAQTRNPWKLSQGASGSSAGPAAATAAGLVGFSIGTETWGSIVSPATRCGATGCRPTFGRVSRHGAMALAWSMDKIGPVCRHVEDCALVLEAICGADGKDPTAIDRPFVWDAERPVQKLRVGTMKKLFAAPSKDSQAKKNDRATLQRMRSLGFELIPIELPDLPIYPMALILQAEAACAFDQLSRSGKDDELVRQTKDAWPNVFRWGMTIPAADYLRANRIRHQAMQAMEQLFQAVDVYLAPSVENANLLLTNLTGHPAVVLPNGFRPDGTPTSISLTGRLFGEGELLALARLLQDSSGHHLKHPPTFS